MCNFVNTKLLSRFIFYFVVGVFTVAPIDAQLTYIPAFPGAEGFGAKSQGGRGGAVIEVTNLDDSGLGSLRACVEASIPRTCIFKIGGTIELLSSLVIEDPYITIAGQTAPGGGITLKNNPNNGGATLHIKTHDVILRYLRLRTGASENLTCCNQSLTITSGYNIMVDHVSASWSSDQILTIFTDPKTESIRDVSVQWSFITEALRRSSHSKGEHSTGAIVGNTNISNISLHHNLFAHNNARNPRFSSVSSLDFVNNVIYNYGQELAFGDAGSDSVSANFIRNIILKGNSNKTDDEFIKLSTNLANPMGLFVLGNIDDRHRPEDTLSEDLVVKERSREFMLSEKIETPPITIHSCDSIDDCQVYDAVLLNSGANAYITEVGTWQTRRDAVDQRIVIEVERREGQIIDATSDTTVVDQSAVEILSLTDYLKYGIDDPIDESGWPVLQTGTPYIDQDHDGMSDTWEVLYGFNSNDNTDNVVDIDGDGYTNLEEFLNGTDPTVSD